MLAKTKIAFAFMLLLCLPSSKASAQDTYRQDLGNSSSEKDSNEFESIVAATVSDAAGGQYEITTGAARALLAHAVSTAVEASNNKALMNAAVNQLVDRRLVYDFLNQSTKKIGEAEIRLELEQFALQLAKVEQTLEAYLTKRSLLKNELEFEIGWRLAWSRYLKDQLTDDLLAKFFEQNRCQFDGSKIKVAHLLVKPSSADLQRIRDAAANRTDASQVYQGQIWVEARTTAETALTKLNTGELSWNEVVEQYSDAPTKTSGGELGWIEYHKPMPPSFSIAAFELKVGEVSQIVKTNVGFHLIKCLDLEAGKTGLKDAMTEVRQSAAKNLFASLVETQRTSQTVEYADGFSK